MKIVKLVTVVALSSLVFGCGVFPFEKKVKDNHFVIENYRQDISTPKEYVYLACYRNRQSDYSESRELMAGRHNLWVKAQFDIGGEGYVNFDVTLDAGQRYALKRQVTDNKAAIWLEETDTSKVVSEVVTTELKIPKVVDNKIRIEQCKSGTV